MLQKVWTIICLTVFVNTVIAQELGESCQTAYILNGKCVSEENCTVFQKIKKSQSLTVENVNYLRSSRCEDRNGINLVCCPSQDIINTKHERYESEFNGYQDDYDYKRELLPQPPLCGLKTPLEMLIDNRVTEGIKADFGEFPWIAHLKYSKGNYPSSFLCAGVLVNNRYVLTAAHCVQNSSTGWRLTHVRLGEFDTRCDLDCVKVDEEDESCSEPEFDIGGEVIFCAEPPVDILVETIIPHIEYKAENESNYNDIALLRLAQIVNYTKFIKPICLPFFHDYQVNLMPNSTVYVAGWGQTENYISSRYLLKADLKVFEKDNCKKIYKKETVVIEDSQVCAGSYDSGKDTCRGDSGGPLMIIYHKNTSANSYYFLVGVTSFGFQQCGLSGVPGIYTNLMMYKNWIYENIDK